MKPIIGIIARNDISSSLKEICYINKEVNNTIIKNGGIPLVITPVSLESFLGKTLENTKKLTDNEKSNLNQIIDLCDGIVCPGGDDFFDYDLKIIEYCYQKDKPLLGICLGMQAMACLFKGVMQDFENFNHKSKEKYVHKVKLNKNSKLYQILQKEEITVNSRHKSYIVSTNLNIVGISDDNIIEAVEDKNKKFFIGVQWHPESMIEYDITENKLFSYFIHCCGGK